MLDYANISSRWLVRNIGNAAFGDNVVKQDEIAATGFTNGSGANQASAFYSALRTVAASVTDALDLSGSLQDNLGNIIALTKVKALRIRADAGNLGDLLIGPAAANGFIAPFNAAADRVRCAPGGVVDLVNPSANGWAVVAGTGDILNIINSSAGGPATYKIEILGA